MDSELTSSHIQDVGSSEERKLLGFTKRQLTFLFTYGVYNIFRGAVILIAGPFYPPEVCHHHEYYPFEICYACDDSINFDLFD